MAYSKTTWANDATPAISASNLNKMETGIYNAHQSCSKLATRINTINNEFIHGKNFFNVANENCVDGYYKYQGNTNANADWFYFVDKIYLEPNTTYDSTVQIFYDIYNDADERIASGYDVSSPFTLTTPADTSYAIFSSRTATKDTAMLYKHGESSAYEPYYSSIKYLKVKSQDIIEQDTRIVVSKSGHGDYTSLLKAIISTTGDIFVKDGTFDLIAEYKSEYGSNYWTNYVHGSDVSNGLPVQDRSIEFAEGTKVVCDLSSANNDAKTYFSSFAPKYNYEIINLTCEQNYGKYVIHNDYNNSNDYVKNHLKNCNLKATNLTSSYNTVIGSGLGMNSLEIYENCYLDAGNTGNSLECHTKNASSDDKSHGKVYIIGCYLVAGMKFSAYGKSTYVSDFICHSNRIKGNIQTQQYGTVNNINVIGYNNEIV